MNGINILLDWGSCANMWVIYHIQSCKTTCSSIWPIQTIYRHLCVSTYPWVQRTNVSWHFVWIRLKIASWKCLNWFRVYVGIMRQRVLWDTRTDRSKTHLNCFESSTKYGQYRVISYACVRSSTAHAQFDSYLLLVFHSVVLTLVKGWYIKGWHW